MKSKGRFCFVKLVLLTLMLSSSSYLFAGNDIDLIMQRIREQTFYSPEDSAVESSLNMIKDDGSFPDIDYSNTDKVGWQPSIHLSRLSDMVFGYLSSGSRYGGSEKLYSVIVKSINFWVDINPYCQNWYARHIGEPQTFGVILIAMRGGPKQLPDSVENKVIQRWRGNGSNPGRQNGANRSDVALQWMYFSCLTNDEDLLHTSMDYLFEPVAFTDKEGLQVDYSFFQHSNQLYIGGYGETMLETVLKAAVCVSGTNYQMSEEKVILLRNYILNTYANVIRGESINWNCAGRSISRSDFLVDPDRRVAIIDKMINVDQTYKDKYQLIKNRLLGEASANNGILPYHTHFHRGDYTIHTRTNWNFSVRFISNRTCRNEYGNGENFLTYYLSDGATDIACSGKEYFNIMPLWDWNKIPGTTSPFLDTIPRVPDVWGVYGSNVYAGGVSDTIYGCSAYRYYDDYSGVNTGASKGYFFFDDEVVCLGAGIRSDYHAVTTVNQCWGGENFVCGNSKGDIVDYSGEIDEIVLQDNKWVLHDGIGYYFPGDQIVVVKNKETIGNWRWISTVQEDKEIVGKIFTLYLDHEKPVDNTTYSYIVRPNSSVSEMVEYISDNPVEILTNTDSVQIVRHKQLNLIECIYYKACTYVGNDISIQSSHPCALLLKEADAGYLIHIADPTQSRQIVKIGVQKKGSEAMSFGECDFSNLDEQYGGMTKVLSIGTLPSGICETNCNAKFTLSKSPYRICFDKSYCGSYKLLSIDGRLMKRDSFEGNQIQFDIQQKGIYLLDMRIENGNHLTVKLIAD